MRKLFVLDTNVILHEPRAIFRFGANDVVLPIYVVEELDRFKKDVSGLGRQAREFSRAVDDLRAKGSLSEGVALDGGGTLRVAFVKGPQPPEGYFAQDQLYDNLIMRCAIELQAMESEREVVLVTKDTNLRIRADVLGLRSEDYEPDDIQMTELYEGYRELKVTAEEMQRCFDGELPISEDETFYANEYVLLRDTAKENHTALARYKGSTHSVYALPRRREPIWGIQARNMEQTFAIDLLLDDSIKLVTLVGKAGTGKTLLALAAGLKKVTDEDTYQRVTVTRPIFPLGRDLGFLPGTVEEKMDPWMKPIYDNVELLLGLSQNGRRDGHSHQELQELGLLGIEPLTYIRGRSIPNQYLIVDEAQNLTPHEVKTIITRAGEGTKIVFTGDPYQIDNPYVDTMNNGLVHLVNRFRGQELAGTVSLMHGERSELAELAANIL